MDTMLSDDQCVIEYQLLEIYHKKRRSKKRRSRLSAEPTLMGWPAKDLQFSGHMSTSTRTRVPASAKTDVLVQVADKLTDIVDSVPPAQDHAVTDSDVIQRLIEILIEYGDQVNEKIVKDTELFSYLQNLVSYNLFEKLASAFILSLVPPGNLREEDHDQEKKIAWTFEMTSRLSALDLHPMNRTMGFGAKYVHQHFAPWIQQHGGWENAFKFDEGDEVQ